MNTQNDSASGSSKPKKKKTKLQMKSPSQERSRQTVSTILNACARLIVSEGFFGVTTDKIAKEAGVSIGSLYQFFGNKESVVSAVIQDLLNQDIEKIRAEMPAIKSLPEAQRGEAFIQLYLNVHKENVELRKAIQSVQNYLLDQNFLKNYVNNYTEILSHVLPHLNNSRTLSFVVANGLIGLTNNLLQDSQDHLDNQEVKNIISRIFAAL